MIKVLNILSDTNIGGAGRSVLEYLAGMDRTRFKAICLVPFGSQLRPRVEELGVEVVETKIRGDKSFDPAAIAVLKREIRSIDPDIVHTHGSLSGRIAARQCGKKVVFTRHSAFPFSPKITGTPLKYGYRYLYGHYADMIVVISPAGEEVLRPLGLPKEKITVMMNGTAPLRRADTLERTRLRQELGIGEEDFVASIVARIEEYKGHTDVLAALKRVLAEEPHVKLIIAGTGSYEKTVQEKTAELGLENSVRFTGFLKDVAPVLSISDVQINASYVSETSSLSLIEGMSIGVPAIASNCCGNPWLVEDGVSGFLFRPRDSADLADKLLILARDSDRRTALGQGALRSYEECFTGRIFAAGLEKVYTMLLEGRDGKEK